MLKRSLCGACTAAYSSRAWIPPAVASQRSSTSTAGPSRSHIFDEPLDPAPRPKSLRRQRQLEQIAAARDGTSNSEREEQARWHADPWYRISRTPVRQCAVTRQKMPSGVMINFRAARLDEGDMSSKRGPPNQLLPDRVLHPRFEERKAGIGVWTICHRETIARLAMGGPHHQTLSRTRSAVSPDIAESVYAQLCERVEQELALLRNRLQSSNVRAAKRPAGASGAASEKPVVLRRLPRAEAEALLAGGDKQESMIAVFDLHDMSERGDQMSDPIPNDNANRIDETYSAPVDVSETDLPMLGPESRVPLYPLARLFPPQRLEHLRELLEGVLRVEALEGKRAQRAAGQPRVNSARVMGTSDLVALYAHPKVNGTGRAGDVGADLAVAFWRLRCFFGLGWEEFDVDRSGRKI